MAELELSAAGLKERSAWDARGYNLPMYDRSKMIAETKSAPEWIHFGAGNIFKAFQASVCQRLLDAGVMTKGIIAVERKKKDGDSHDGLSVVVTLKSDGTVDKSVLGAVAETCYLYGSEERIGKIFASPSLKMASFSITEKGYAVTDSEGNILPDVAYDLTAGPSAAKTYMGRVAALLFIRYKAGQLPIAMVSMDNCSHNGDKLYSAVSLFSDNWVKNGLVPPTFADYIDSDKVSFPWTMIDKITPSPAPSVGQMLERDGLHGFTLTSNARGTVSAPFVNAEETEYLVIEDDFPNGKLPLDKAGIYYTDRETVNKVERMKVTTCLNPLHTTLAVYGCLLGYERIYDEMKDPQLTKLIHLIGYKEGLPVVTNPGILDPKEFIDTVINIRFMNPFMPDTPQRIATDTSQKLPVRFGETIKAYINSENHNVSELKYIPLTLAGWLRYLMAVNDAGEEFTPSPDPLLKEAQMYVADISIGDVLSLEQVKEKLGGLLSNDKIFGTDLIACGMADTVCRYFAEEIAGVGAVRSTLMRYVG